MALSNHSIMLFLVQVSDKIYMPEICTLHYINLLVKQIYPNISLLAAARIPSWHIEMPVVMPLLCGHSCIMNLVLSFAKLLPIIVLCITLSI